MLKSNSSYINFLHIGETSTIFSLIYLPLDLASDYLEFGAFILYRRTEEVYSNFYKIYDELIWETLCVKRIKKVRMINQGMCIYIHNEYDYHIVSSYNLNKNLLDLGHLLPSMTYLIFTATNSVNQQWDVSLLPFLLEQYLGVISREDSENDLSKDYRPLDGLSWIKIFRSYKCLGYVEEVDQFSRVTKQIMTMRGQNDRYLIKMLLNLLKELHEDILFLFHI
jgi:hypothetical protein